ncbi:oligosaccharide repeat unit polymerase [Agitococcus lubricus]|uniref:Oligosaccharide repeat unit polymerase n=2 Tax=Agitococcus lubricus TaxID=1077255 RepID=A0A2T5J0D5_9GAMM|nr:oligosaccharide repeat unit polymerase [Agitococcus lubricus]
MAIALWCYGILTSQDIVPIFLTLPTFLLVLYKLTTINGNKFNADDMIWLCCLLFFVVAPCQQIVNYQFPKSTNVGVYYEVSDFLVAELIVFLSCLSFILASSKKNQNEVSSFEDTLHIKSVQLFQLFGIALFCFIIYVIIYGPSNLFASRFDKDLSDSNFLSVPFLAMLTVATTIFAITVNKKSSIFVMAAFLLLTMLLFVAVNPTNMSRFFNVATWAPVIFGFFSSGLSFIYIYLFIMMGIFIIMPFISITTRFGLAGLQNIDDKSRDLFILKDMDVFNTLVHGVKYMSNKDYLWGDNTLAVIFFFVPRSIWSDKPILGGLLVGDELKYYYEAGTANLSYFFGGDLYMDFGLIGVIFGFWIIGKIYKKSQLSSSIIYNKANLISLMVIGSVPILIRGPLGAVEGYFICLLLAIYTYSSLYKLKLKQY